MTLSFQKVLTPIGSFCICTVALGIMVEIIVMYPIQKRQFLDGMNNLLVLVVGGIPIAMPTVLFVTMAVGSHKLSQQGAITNRTTAIEEMAGMDSTEEMADMDVESIVRMNNYSIHAVSVTVRIVLGFLLALIWGFDFSPFMVLLIVVVNDVTIMTISKDRVIQSPLPHTWKLKEIFATGIVLGTYLGLVTFLFFWVAQMMFSSGTFDLRYWVSKRHRQFTSAVYLQVSISGQASIFVTRSWDFSYLEQPGLLLVTAFFISQIIATLLAVYVDWEFATIAGVGWERAGIIWLYSFVTYVPLMLIKFAIYYVLSPRAVLLERKTGQNDFGRENPEAQWAHAH